MKPRTILIVLALSGSALAVAPASWNHASEADFSPGKFKDTAVSSLGQISLSRQISLLMPSGQAPSAVSALAAHDGAVYVASGVRPVIDKIEGRQSKPFAKLPAAMVTSLTWTGKELLAGAGGQGAGLYAIDAAGKATLRWQDPAVKYVWAILRGPKDTLYVATGPNAAVYTVRTDGGSALLYQADKKLAKNILCLAQGKDGLLYAGTDENGLVVEINPLTKASRVVLNAAEKEISCLLAGPEAGELFAATSEAGKASNHEASHNQVGGPVVPAGLLTASQPEGDQGEEEGNDEGDQEESDAEESTAAAPDEAKMKEGPLGGKFVNLSPAAAGPAGGSGNAVYHVLASGLVQTIFRKPVTILAMIDVNGRLILGTGNGGVVYSLLPDSEEVTQLAHVDAKQITALATDAEGRILLGTSNKGSVAALGPAIAFEGTYTSKALDAQQIAQWGTAKIRVSGLGKVTFATRSGNLAEVDDKTWSVWSDEKTVGEGLIPITSPAARFLQYRLTLKAAGKVGEPTVQQVEIIYQVGNLPPVVSSILVKPSATPREGGGPQEQPGPLAYRLIRFNASDVNNDKMIFTVAIRPFGAKEWVKLADKLEQPNYVWDTRTVGDGVYELKVTASDSPSNPPASALEGWKISPPLVVDNTAPVVVALAAKIEDGKVSVNGTAVDAGSRIATIHYATDSQQDWVAVLPAGGMADSGREDFAFRVEDLKPGPHRIAVKVTDIFGNAGYGTLNVTTGSKSPTTAAATAPGSE
ncbi:MAG: hypothetical protein ABSH10_05690 [Phycisphaerae bacterium]|jgi:hypothetical protein